MTTALRPRAVSSAILCALLLGAQHVLAAPAFVSTPDADVRSAPFAIAPAVHTFMHGDAIDVSLKLENGWRQVQLSDGRFGYVEDARIKLVGAEAPRDRGASLLARPTPGPHRWYTGVQDVNHRWYGWQLALSDVTFLVVGSVSKGGSGGFAAVLGLVLGAPALHFANGDAPMGLASLAVRGALIGGLAAAGASWKPAPACNDDTCKQQIGDVVPAVLATIGAMVFIVVDDTVLSRRSESADAPVASASIAKPMLAPAVAPSRGGATLTLLGTF